MIISIWIINKSIKQHDNDNNNNNDNKYSNNK